MKLTPQNTFALLGAVLMLLAWGCASIGSPSGGPRDEDPPRFVAANPAPGSVNVDPSQINIDFNELVNVKDAFEKVILSPPGKSTPRVTTRGRRVIVNISDTLLENTTYTIDFGDAIEDNNESNKLSSFAYTFSTGPDLDSLRISGMVLGAEDLEPQQGVLVGAYTSDADSAFLKMPFQRLARTDEYGRFIIRGLQDTTYRLFALKDLDNDKHYANPEEDIAWFGDVIRPYAERVTVSDTIRNLLNGDIDTVVQRERTRFLPNNILLRMYNTRVKPQYLVSYTRPDSTRLEFIFNAPSQEIPKVVIAGEDDFMAPLQPERSIGNDSLKFWLPPSLATRDTLRLALEYVRTDVQTGLETTVNDTVTLTKPNVMNTKDKDKKKKKKKKKDDSKKDLSEENSELTDADGNPVVMSDSEAKKEDEEEEEKEPEPTFSFTAKGPDADITQPLNIEVPVPLMRLDTLAFRLETKPDSVWLPVKGAYRLEHADTLSQRRFKIEYPWERGVAYRIVADSLAATDIYGVNSTKLELEFRTKPEEELSNLKLTITDLAPETGYFVQLLSSDTPKYYAKVEDGVAQFTGIAPGKYYARIYEDYDGNGAFTPGSYRLQRLFVNDTDTIGYDSLVAVQPDLVFYYPKLINVKKNWDVEQTWAMFETPVDKQKPDKIKKNKPKRSHATRERNSGDEEDEDEDEFGGNMFNTNRNTGGNRTISNSRPPTGRR